MATARNPDEPDTVGPQSTPPLPTPPAPTPPAWSDLLPEVTADERDPGTPPGEQDDRDAWYHRERPPHHG